MLTPTREQANIFLSFKEKLSSYRENSLPRALVVDAGAGTGKTRTVLEVARHNPSEEFRMICFNRANAEELNEKAKAFRLTNLKAITLHKLAYEWFIARHSKNRIQNFIDVNWFTDNIVLPNGSGAKAREVAWECVNILAEFCSSPDVNFDEFGLRENISGTVAHFCSIYLDTLVAPESTSPLTINAVLKLYQQQQEQAFPEGYVIVVEEYQDINPVQSAWIMNQKNFLFFIGDKFQRIYSWRQGGSLLPIVSGDEEQFPKLLLTTSFRVNPSSADLANKILSHLNGPTLIGASKKEIVETEAFLFRTNASVLYKSFELMENNTKHVIKLDLPALWNDLWWVADRLSNKPLKPSKSPLKVFKTRKDILDAADELLEVAALLKILDFFSAKGGLFKVQKKMQAFYDSIQEANVVVSTGHKAKGLEWDKVTLGDDFLLNLYKQQELIAEAATIKNIEAYEEELRLLYVALTRAKVKTLLPDNLREFLENLSSAKKSLLEVEAA